MEDYNIINYSDVGFDNEVTVIDDDAVLGDMLLSENQIETIRYLNKNLSSMPEREGAEFLQALLPAIMPVVSQVLPHLLPAAIGMLPSAAQTFSKVISSITQSPSPSSPKIQPSNQPLTPQAPATSPINSSISPFIANLLALIQNPQILNLLSNLAAGLSQTGASTPAGTVVPVRDILGSISSLAGSAAATTPTNTSMVSKESDYNESAESIANMFK
jgi:hypothetical protein